MKRKRTFTIYYFNPKTRCINVVAKMKTKPVTKEECEKLMMIELAKNPDSVGLLQDSF